MQTVRKIGGAVAVQLQRDFDLHALAARDVVRSAGLVPQDAGLLLYHDTVAAECTAGDRDADLAPGTTRAVLDRLVPGIDGRAQVTQWAHDLAKAETTMTAGVL